MIKELKGGNFPVMNNYERLLNILSIEHVDDVILNIPYKITPQLIEEYSINVIVNGKTTFLNCYKDDDDPYELIKHLDILKDIDSGIKYNIDDIVDRINNNEKLKEKLKKKVLKLNKYYENKKKNNWFHF